MHRKVRQVAEATSATVVATEAGAEEKVAEAVVPTGARVMAAETDAAALAAAVVREDN